MMGVAEVCWQDQSVTTRLVALDDPPGPGFVDALRRCWDRGDAVLPVEQGLPPAARVRLLRAMAPDIVAHGGMEQRYTGERGGVADLVPGDALVVATSGSTGVPKGVVLTRDAVAASAHATAARIGTALGDHWLACLPLSHVGGLAVVSRALALETPLTVLPRFDPAAVAASSATLVSLVRTMLARVDTSHFRVVVVGGSPGPLESASNVVCTYGLTETGSGVVYDGRPLDGVDVDIDERDGIRLRGPMLLRAYRDGTEPFGADGWFATGDVGRWAEDGRLDVLGRRDDLIISGGENVWPEPVEQVLRRHPLVADVAVAGRPHPEWGQVVSAFVVPAGADRPTLEDLRRWVKDELPPYCAPHQLHLVPAIPRTSLGKPRRRALGDPLH
jgi:O-succinylbenzoic acid--CoA ligase